MRTIKGTESSEFKQAYQYMHVLFISLL